MGDIEQTMNQAVSTITEREGKYLTFRGSGSERDLNGKVAITY